MSIFKLAVKANTRAESTGTKSTSTKVYAPMSYNLKHFKTKDKEGILQENSSPTFTFSTTFIERSGIQVVGDSHKSINYFSYGGGVYITTQSGNGGTSMNLSTKAISNKKSLGFTSSELASLLKENGIMVNDIDKVKFNLVAVPFPVSVEDMAGNEDFLDTVLETYQISVRETVVGEESEEDDEQPVSAPVEAEEEIEVVEELTSAGSGTLKESNTVDATDGW